jgi:hypothetical protein
MTRTTQFALISLFALANVATAQSFDFYRNGQNGRYGFEVDFGRQRSG